MYLHNIKIWNFRKIGTSDKSEEIKKDNPGIDLTLNPHLNVLIGENNSGKSTIVDAIRLVLGSQAFDYYKVEEKDFHFGVAGRSREMRIECSIKGFDADEAGAFLEWISFDEKKKFELRVWLYAYVRDNRVIVNVKAGADSEGTFMDAGAKDLLRLTYLKPLRDAESELSPGYKSRLAQILVNDPLFKDQFGSENQKLKHTLEKYVSNANKLIRDYFTLDSLDKDDIHGILEGTVGGKSLKDKLEGFLNDFFHIDESQDPYFHISESELASILRRLGLALEENKSGLGALNKLFIAAELLLLQGKGFSGLRLLMVEELEAHLHPQAQVRVINALQNKRRDFNNQFILTTHSTTLASKLQLNNFILTHSGQAFSLGHGQTGLHRDDYEFLERFLDATQANLFFAKGVILVEGAAENILVPAIAEIIGRPLDKYGVSVVSVGSKAFLRYAKIFKRKNETTLPIKAAIITDLDIEQINVGNGVIQSKKRGKMKLVPNAVEESKKLVSQYDSEDGRIKTYHSPLWTMEYDLAMGNFAEYMNCAIYIAQLAKSRTASHNFKGITNHDAFVRIRKARDFYGKWQEKDLSQEAIAFNIYERLANNKASKAVTAQWLVKMLLRHKSKVKDLLLADPNFKYITDAIYHVTKPADGDNGK
ncbi:ATP-dependent nuclease [Flavobacterium alkalisoli]|uniref:ATP-dependent nuclease n=1 Tax=Flavobacterium alkalisoli TaxID=2602769 RepID=UPI003A94E321